jgi:hypothetical protein
VLGGFHATTTVTSATIANAGIANVTARLFTQQNKRFIAEAIAVLSDTPLIKQNGRRPLPTYSFGCKLDRR